jgi:outer membrane protein OmpA-like peptidoglycan-associated protein
MVAIRSGTLCASALTLALLGACNAPPAGDAPAAAAEAAVPSHCVTLAEGLYEFEDGQFLAVTADSAAASGAANLQREIQAGFTGLGFPWMGLKIRDRVAVLTGTAPSADAKAAALSAGATAIAAHPQAGLAGLLVVDALSIEAGERGAGESLAALVDTGISLEACQRAFVDTMQGRTIQFESGNARISPVSTPLLDAVSGVALLCQQFVLEIGSHTDSRGNDAFNLTLSQQRADALRDYLIGKGVTEDVLLSVGYGETRPLDPALNAEAYDRNRRTEFNVSAR